MARATFSERPQPPRPARPAGRSPYPPSRREPTGLRASGSKAARRQRELLGGAPAEVVIEQPRGLQFADAPQPHEPRRVEVSLAHAVLGVGADHLVDAVP